MRLFLSMSVALLWSRYVFAGSVITTNLPPFTAIINISGTVDGAGSYDGSQDKWYQPFSANGAGALLKYTVQPGMYTFRLTNPTLAASDFPGLTAGQLSTIYTAWTYNSPWVTDYLVFDEAAAGTSSLPQLFSGAITPTSDYPGYTNAAAAFDTAEAKGFANQIIDSPGGRYTGTAKSQRAFTAAETLIFAVPDPVVSDNGGGVSVVVSLTGDGIPADYNANGAVDAADYVLWRNGGALQNEIVTFGSNTAEDYAAWRARYGNYAANGAAGLFSDGAQVPEPTTGILLAIGIAAIWTRRRTIRDLAQYQPARHQRFLLSHRPTRARYSSY